MIRRFLSLKSYIGILLVITILCIFFVIADTANQAYINCTKQGIIKYQQNVEKILALIMDEIRIDMNQIAYDIVNNHAEPVGALDNIVNERYSWMKWATIPTQYRNMYTRHFLTEKFNICKPETNKNAYEWVIPIEVVASGSCYAGKFIFGVTARYIKEKVDRYLLDQDMMFMILDESHDLVFLYNDERGEDSISKINNNALFKFYEYPLFLYVHNINHSGKYLHLSSEIFFIILIIIIFHVLLYYILNNTLKTLSSPIDKRYLSTFSCIYEVDLVLKRIKELTQQNVHSKITIQNLSILNEELKGSQESVEMTCKRLRHLLEEAIADRDASIIFHKTMEDRLQYAEQETRDHMRDQHHKINFMINILHEILQALDVMINRTHKVILSSSLSDVTTEYVKDIECTSKVIVSFIDNIAILLKMSIDTLELNLEEINLPSLINDCIDKVLHFYIRYNVKITHTIDEDINKVKIDRALVQCVINGLLDSIIKSSDCTVIDIKVYNHNNVPCIQIVYDGMRAILLAEEDFFQKKTHSKLEVILYIINKVILLHNGEFGYSFNKEETTSVIMITFSG